MEKENYEPFGEEWQNEMLKCSKVANRAVCSITEKIQEVEVCEWSEVNKLIKAFQDKYNDPGCNGLPYEPKTIKVNLIALPSPPPTNKS